MPSPFVWSTVSTPVPRESAPTSGAPPGPAISWPLVRPSAAAEVLGWPVGEVYAAAEAGTLPAIGFAGTIRFDGGSLAGREALPAGAAALGTAPMGVVEVAEALATSVVTVRFLIRCDSLPMVSDGSIMAIDAAALAVWVAQRRSGPGPGTALALRPGVKDG